MTDDDKVGYCRPPKASRFKKGKAATRSARRAKFESESAVAVCRSTTSFLKTQKNYFGFARVIAFSASA